MEKDNRWKWKSNKAGRVILISDKIDFKKKKCCKRQLHNDQTINQRIKSYDCKYICTNIGVLLFIRQIIMAIKGAINSNTIIMDDINTPLLSKDR